MTHKILLDTDIGTDIDDAVCLAYLLAQPSCELLGLTTVSGQPVARAQVASAICYAAGREVPIYPGAEHPRRVAQQQPVAQQVAALTRWPHQRDFPAGQAIEFLRQTVRHYPGEVTLLAIGPLTNVAALFEADPDLPRLLRGLMLMGGAFTLPRAEWNMQCDPHAAALVYGTACAVHRSVGLDVTRHLRLPASQARRRFAASGLAVVADLAEIFFKHNKHLTFHDPLAAAALFEADLCRFERGRVTVEVDDVGTIGATRWTPGPTGPHEVALAVQADRFLEHYFSVIQA